MVTLRSEMIPCGKNCSKCPHGPYWYAYWREGDKVRKKYLGKVILTGEQTSRITEASKEAVIPIITNIKAEIASEKKLKKLPEKGKFDLGGEGQKLLSEKQKLEIEKAKREIITSRDIENVKERIKEKEETCLELQTSLKYFSEERFLKGLTSNQKSEMLTEVEEILKKANLEINFFNMGRKTQASFLRDLKYWSKRFLSEGQSEGQKLLSAKQKLEIERAKIAKEIVPLPPIPSHPKYPINYKNKNASRKEKNEFLKSHGYRWQKESFYVDSYMASVDPELADYDGDFISKWILRASNGTQVTDSEKILVDLGFYGEERKTYQEELIAYEEKIIMRKQEIKKRETKIDEFLRTNYKKVEYPEKVKPFDKSKIYHIPGKGFDIYGGGRAFAITEDEIWELDNNGMDGDDWSRNNYPTGGAGAIAKKYPMDSNIANIIKSLAKGLIDSPEELESKWVSF